LEAGPTDQTILSKEGNAVDILDVQNQKNHFPNPDVFPNADARSGNELHDSLEREPRVMLTALMTPQASSMTTSLRKR
jgi:hypothetical protein